MFCQYFADIFYINCLAPSVLNNELYEADTLTADGWTVTHLAPYSEDGDWVGVTVNYNMI